MKNVVIVLPTYNEKHNIGRTIDMILYQQFLISNWNLSILVVDDSSPDGTAEVVKKYVKQYPNIHLLSGKKNGLGAAYIRGFKYAIRHLDADVVFEMDADGQHDPNDIPRFMDQIEHGFDFVIGSRYVKGGSVPAEWPLLRKVNSYLGNFLARYLAGLKPVKDCTSGFRAINTGLLKKIHIDRLHVKGYVFVVSLLYHAKKNNAKVKEIPIQFTGRRYGESKLKISDVIEFILHAFSLRFGFLKPIVGFFVLGAVLGTILPIVLSGGISNLLQSRPFIISLITVTSSVLIIQGILTIWQMIFAWEDAEEINRHKSPKQFIKPGYSFTAIVPARQEEAVINDTITSIAKINYPEELKETIIVCRTDDKGTINKVNQTIAALGLQNIRLVTFDDEPINKPHSLNFALIHATKDVVVIFDAEDEPHKDIYQIVNTVMHRDHADVVQSGVQLMNFNSTWFSTLNVLEYFFWFKSTLQFFASKNFIPLGGNTVFIKRRLLEKTGGWDEECLTEDADLGIRLSTKKANIRVVYDEEHTTREETPLTLGSFVKQRTRWNQGFMQVLMKGDWIKLPKTSQKLLAFYILAWPIIQSIFFLYIPFSIYMILRLDLPMLVTLLATVPIYLLGIQVVIYMIGMYEFTRDYGFRFPLLMPVKILITFFPFTLIHGFSTFRAVLRMIFGNNEWEKTTHTNAHRETSLGDFSIRNLLPTT